MKISIGDSKHNIVFEEGLFAVHLPDAVFKADSIAQLIDDLKKAHKEVVLPDTTYASDLSIVEVLVKAGFKYLHVDKVYVGGRLASLQVSHFSPERMNAVLQEQDKGNFRFYEARWTDEKGKEQSNIYSEVQLEASRMVYSDTLIEALQAAYREHAA